MAIDLEFIDFIVPIKHIETKYPGGWEACLEYHAPAIGGRVWYDEHLFRDGAMSPMDIKALLDEWTNRGFEPYETIDGSKKWKDVCVVESMLGGPTLPCDWLIVREDEPVAYLVGTEPGEVIGRFEVQKP